MNDLDYGTPAVVADREVTLNIDGIAVSVPAGTSIMRAAVTGRDDDPQAVRNGFAGAVRLLPLVSGRNRRPARLSVFLHDAGRSRHESSHPIGETRRSAAQCDGTVYLRPPARLPDLRHQRQLRTANRGGPVGLREVRYGMAGANHFTDAQKDESNPYFTFDPGKCIVCNRCVRACEETQGTFALTISGRGFESRVSASQSQDFMDSECVSCGACVNACPTATLVEKTVIEKGQAEHAVLTTCAYCGVGCGFKAEMKGSEVVRMVPWKDGQANEGHACVKGRFAWGYATHPDRITKPMIRAKISDPWREVSWDEAIAYTARELRRVQEKHGKNSIGALVSSRCTNEEDYLVQKLVRTAFGNNNVDTCARVCHSPTGYGLKQTLGESAGTQTFKSVEKSDVILIIGANPTDGHPVFASRLKRRVREGAKLIIVDPRNIDLVNGAARPRQPSPETSPRHQCRGAHCTGACDRE